MNDGRNKPILKPCPFCGKIPTIYKRSMWQIIFGYCIECTYCKVRTSISEIVNINDGRRMFKSDSTKNIKDKEAILKAIEKWNNRV